MDSFSDPRIVELQWEEVLGRLRRLRSERSASSLKPAARAEELLEISRTLREMSIRTRNRSRLMRSPMSDTSAPR